MIRFQTYTTYRMADGLYANSFSDTKYFIGVIMSDNVVTINFATYFQSTIHKSVYCHSCARNDFLVRISISPWAHRRSPSIPPEQFDTTHMGVKGNLCRHMDYMHWQGPFNKNGLLCTRPPCYHRVKKHILVMTNDSGGSKIKYRGHLTLCNVAFNYSSERYMNYQYKSNLTFWPHVLLRSSLTFQMLFKHS